MARIVQISTVILLAAASTSFLAGCSINVNDGENEHGNFRNPRTATDICRREVDRSYGDRYRIAFDLPELTSNGGTQTVHQPFTMASRKDSFEAPQRRALRCTIVDGILTQAGPG
ncbi:hypothetical protein GE253_07125 [Niveispirillum sp. SYP-B3756]|uniref:hypothetical protein n=1 Tax=Niveispirillum sp. SYP-B3756 TaxID=2662178 RepID=UPI0012924CD8|nr:hypothetical protein [Niveispirillum sp. SYP-B3756]MQP65118.1 hypothetical protein [Niveispirillum sp. SYP-B3756]